MASDLKQDIQGSESSRDEKLAPTLNKRERIARRRIYERYQDMRDDPLRKSAEEDWETADKAFVQYIPKPDPDDWRAHLELPDSFAAIQSQMQETIDRKSRPTLKRVEDSDKSQEELANSVMTYNLDKTDFDYQYWLAKYSAASRGTAFLFDYWRLDKRIVQDVSRYNKEDNRYEYTEREIVDFDDDYTEWIENEFIFVDESARNINEAVDCVRREILPLDEFKRVYAFRPDFMNVDKVKMGGETKAGIFFQLPSDIRETDVEILHYYNRAEDLYWVVANNMPVRIGPIPYKHKELPLAVVYQYRVPGNFWGMGIPKVIAHLSEERKSIRNLNIDRQKLHLNKMFLHNSTFDLDDEDLISRPHGLISVDTQGLPLNQVIQPLEYGDVPASYFRTEEILLEDIRRAHGIDDRIQGVNVGGTATEAAILKESALKRVNMIAQLSEMDTLIRLGRLKWSNIQFFYPIPKIERITEENQERERKVFRKISVDGKQFTVVKGAEGNKLKMSEIDGASVLKLDRTHARYIEGAFDIVVDANAFSPISKPIQQAKVTEMFNLLVANPALIGVLDPKKSVTRYIEVNNENPKSWMMDTALNQGDMMLLAERENEVMAQGIPLAPTVGASENHTLVHLNFTRTREYEQLSEIAQQLFIDHITGEHSNNPATSSVPLPTEASGGGGAMPPTSPMAGASPPGLQPANGTGNQLQAADITPTSLSPEE